MFRWRKIKREREDMVGDVGGEWGGGKVRGRMRSWRRNIGRSGR